VRETQRAVTFHIEELMLDGFAPGDRYRIAEAMQQELTGLLTHQGAPVALASRGETDRVDGGAIRLAVGATPGAIGNQLAGALYGGLSR
jgi:hypothetical protein